MTFAAVGFAISTNRMFVLGRVCIGLGMITASILLLASSDACLAQASESAPATPPAVATSSGAAPDSSAAPGPIAFVPLDNNHPDSAAKVTGAIEVSAGRAVIAKSGTVTSGSKTTDVVLPQRGVLRVCASTSVHLSSDASVPAGETPGLMMALDHGAVEASFATGRNSDILLTPDFRILIGGPGSAEVKIRLGQHGDTCVDNPGLDAPYVVVSSVFEGGAYRVQPGQRVMFQHGSLNEVVDQEKEPCGCPAEPRPGTNDFPLAQSAGLAPLASPAPAPAAKTPPSQQQQLNEPLVYSAPAAKEEGTNEAASGAGPSLPPQPAATPARTPATKKRGFFGGIGHFFRRIFGAE